MSAPPSLPSWLLEATLLPEAEAILGDLWEEFHEHIAPTRGATFAKTWYCWQVARSLTPLILRSWQRASVTRAWAAVAAAATTATLPAAALLSLRRFVLTQVPLKTTAEFSGAFLLALGGVVLVSGVGALAMVVRLLHKQPR